MIDKFDITTSLQYIKKMCLKLFPFIHESIKHFMKAVAIWRHTVLKINVFYEIISRSRLHKRRFQES